MEKEEGKEETSESDGAALKLRVSTGWPMVAILLISPIWVPTLAAAALAFIALIVSLSSICIAIIIPVFVCSSMWEWFSTRMTRRRRKKAREKRAALDEEMAAINRGLGEPNE